MASIASVCSMCDRRHLTTLSSDWCLKCDEALCVACSQHHSLSKPVQDHKIISIAQYRSSPFFVPDIQQFCILHKEKYRQYCTKHECPICHKCYREHRKCIDIVPLDNVVSQIKTSESLRDLEQSLDDILQNIKRFRADRDNNVISITRQKNDITMEIDSMKMLINNHLDTLKEDFLKELDKVCHSYSDGIQTTISSLSDQEKEMEHCKNEVTNMKKYATNLQTFHGIRTIQPKVIDNEMRLQTIIENKCLKNINIQFELDYKIHDILTSVRKFGSILIKEIPSNYTNISSKKNQQAQISVPKVMQSINNISVEFKHTLNTKCKWPTGCLINRKGGFLLTDYAPNEKLVYLNAKFKTEYTIKLSTPYSSFDLSCLDENIVAVTTGHLSDLKQRSGISIIDLTKRKIRKFVDLPGDPYGITYDGKSMICRVKDKDLHVIACDDYRITTIPNTAVRCHSYVATYADKILYTNPEENKVFCCLFNGTRLWEFHDKTVLKTPQGITVDDQGNVFVVGRSSCNVLVISPDGKQYKQILNRKNGILGPFSIFCDNFRKQLLVTNQSPAAHLYEITYFRN